MMPGTESVTGPSTGGPAIPTRFGGRVVVVSGAAAGIGRATAVRFAAEGAVVALLDRDRAGLTETASLMQAPAGTQQETGPLLLEVDITSETSVGKAIAQVLDTFGGVDILVNSAGTNRYGIVEEQSVSDFELVLDTNLKGAFLTSRLCIPVMRARGGGAIVNLASVQAFGSQRTVAAYSASKGAVVSMTRSLALDHASEGIRVNCVCPGSVLTPMLEESARTFHPESQDLSAVFEQWGRTHPIGRLIDPAEVASLVAFLASDEAKAITGSPFLIDGGLTAKLAVEG